MPKQHRMVNAMKALFLDRDGVINEDTGYPHLPEHIRFLPGIIDFCQLAQRKGYHLFIVTNQAGIGRGYYDEATFLRLMQWMEAQLAEKGVIIEHTYFCPHHPEAGIGHYKQQCSCRKPAPGMLLQAAQEWSIDLAASLMVGDRETDCAAAQAAGVRAVLFQGDFKALEEQLL